jgi:hypothetical protein
MAADHEPAPTRRHRPRAATVFIAAFVAGAAAAVGINRVLDVHLAQAKPQVECEPIFVALRSLPQGVPVTVWDVALRDWPKAMMPTAAVRVNDTFAGCLLKHPLREGQPLLTVQLLPPAEPVEPLGIEPNGEGPDAEETFVPPVPATAAIPPAAAPQPEQAATPTMPPVAPPEAAMASTATEPTEADAMEAGAGSNEAVSSPDAVTGLAEALPAEIGPASTEAGDSLVAAEAAEPAAMKPIAVEPVAAESAATAAVIAAQPASMPSSSEPAPVPAAADHRVAAPDVTQPAVVAVRQEPTPAAEPAESVSPFATATAPQPAAIGPQLLGRRPEGFAPLDVPSRHAPDIASLPSVMARNEETATVEQSEPGDSSVRYLVVPERIAQQADTSFTMPTAPAVATAAPEQRPTAAQEPSTVQQPAAGQPVARKSGGQPGMNRGPSRSPNRTATSRSPAPKPQATQAKPTDRAAAESSTWGSMFPNVSAGIEAIGKWRTRSREAVADEPRSPQPRR